MLASFDAGGGTRRWNRAAEELTGRRVQMVPHFVAFVSVLGLGPEAREVFSGWFWGPSVGSHATDVFASDGVPRRMLWRKSVTLDEGRAERRVLVGVELPRREPISGDSAGGAVPHLEAIRSAETIRT